MTLTSGTKLGAYETLATLGGDGMGEVYRARDTRFDCTDAVKILASHLSSNLKRSSGSREKQDSPDIYVRGYRFCSTVPWAGAIPVELQEVEISELPPESSERSKCRSPSLT
jgi:hypothetical protein